MDEGRVRSCLVVQLFEMSKCTGIESGNLAGFADIKCHQVIEEPVAGTRRIEQEAVAIEMNEPRRITRRPCDDTKLFPTQINAEKPEKIALVDTGESP